MNISPISALMIIGLLLNAGTYIWNAAKISAAVDNLKSIVVQIQESHVKLETKVNIHGESIAQLKTLTGV